MNNIGERQRRHVRRAAALARSAVQTGPLGSGVVGFVTIFALLAACYGTAHARPQYAAAENVSCAYCHVNPSGGGPRNYRGLYYFLHNHTFANFDDAAEAKRAGVPLGPDAASHPRSLTAPGATAAARDAVSLVPPITAPRGWVLQPKTTAATAAVEGDALKVTVPAMPEKYLQLVHAFSEPPREGAHLLLRFRAKADAPCTLRVIAQRNDPVAKDYASIGLGKSVSIGTDYQEFDIPWTVMSPHAQRNKIAFSLAALAAGAKPVTLYLTDVTLVTGTAASAAGAAVGSLPPPTATEPPIPYVDPHTLPDFARWQDPVSRLWFLKIPAGRYRRGTTENDKTELMRLGLWSPQNADEMPAKTVEISRPFLLGEKEVTQAEWTRVMEGVQNGRLANPSAFHGPLKPVDSVTFRDAQLFCRTLRDLSGGKAYYRLPTEAEWEYAARAGATGPWALGEDKQPITPERMKDYCWMSGTSAKGTGRAGAKKPNAWGLYDMLGNVWEWCADNYSPSAYAEAPERSPVYNSPAATERVLRGGSWLLDARAQRPGLRGGGTPDFKSPYVGLRVVRDL